MCATTKAEVVGDADHDSGAADDYRDGHGGGDEYEGVGVERKGRWQQGVGVEWKGRWQQGVGVEWKGRWQLGFFSAS